jgi:hypothetical protein
LRDFYFGDRRQAMRYALEPGALANVAGVGSPGIA